MPKAHGIDVSKYDYPVDPSKATGVIDFIIQRVSYGTMPDERLNEIWNAIRTIPVRGAYHYFSTGSPWKAQADFFLSLVKGKDYHFYAIDYETAYNNLNATSAANLRAMLEYLAAKVSPKKVLFYTSPSIYNTYLYPFGDWMKEWELWLAQYPYLINLDLEKGPITFPKGRTQWTFWQYGGGGIQGTAGYGAGSKYGVGGYGCDLDVFNGTVEQLRAWAGISGTTPLPPPVPDERAIRLDEIRRLETYLNARKAELG